MRDFTSPPELRTIRVSDADLQERVTQLGLSYALVTNWTSFVAVSQRVVNANPGSAHDADVPLAMPEGVGPGAYGMEAGAPIGMNFSGSSTPEPGTLALLTMLLAITAFGARPILVRMRRDS